ncbi:MAG: aquaporin [Byssovorax sp.]
MRRFGAELIGTFAIVLTGVGAAVVGGARIGDAGVALAFGLALAAMLFAAGPISGGHFNPAISLAMCLAGRLRWADLPGYVAAQLAGATLGAAAVVGLATGRPGGAPRGAEHLANGYGQLSPGFYGLRSALIAEVLLTAIFVFVVLGVTRPASADLARPPGARPAAQSPALAPIASGLTYTLIHLVGLPVTRLAANPARAFGPALLAGGEPLHQLWVFVLAPLAGGALAAFAHRALHAKPASHLAQGEPGGSAVRR